MLVSVVSPGTLHCSYWATEDWSSEAFNLISDAAVVAFPVESEGKKTGSLYPVLPVPGVIRGICSTLTRGHFIDVPVTS